MNKILFICFLVSSFIQAQNKLISGKIVIDGEEELSSFEGINIINSTSSAKTTSNSSGIFSIKVSLNDELIFKDGGIEERSLKITETILNKDFVIIHLAIEVIELKETIVNTLKKNFKDNINKEETLSEKINKRIGIDEKFKFDMIEAHYAARYLKKYGFEGSNRYENFIEILDQFGNKAKGHKQRLKQIEKSENKYNQIRFIQDFYTENYFVDDLKIPKGKVTDFIDYCYKKYNFRKLLKDNNYDEILNVIEEQASIYLTKLNSNE